MSEISENKELETLIKLQSLDTKIYNIKKVSIALPKEINTFIEKYNEKENILNETQKKIEECQRQCRKKEREIQATKDSLTKLNLKLNDVKTNKEYSAILNEIESTKNKIINLEDEELSFMDTQENLVKLFKEKKIKLKEEKETLEMQKKKNQGNVLKNELALKEDSERRKIFFNSLNAEISLHYEKILNSRGNLAVALFKDDVCQGCFKRIIPQLVVQLRKGNKIIKCPHCNRFLYWKN